MNIVNEMKLQFCAKSLNEGFARGAISAFLMHLDPTVSELAEIKTALSEAVTNAIIHGYKGEDGTVYIEARVTDKNKVILKIRDKGAGIENVEDAMEPLFTTGGSEQAGLGFTVMQSFMDKVSVRSQQGKGTVVTMEKSLVKRRKNEKP
ncbi:MAG: anti-sigma F factor [Eubacteriales bacterium]|nr:anti-sigma F factor [Eubacteriales bacterium]